MKPIALFALAVATFLHVGLASASHKSWLQKNGGADCVFSTPNSSDSLAGGVFGNRSTTQTRTAICPVGLSGRWGSNGATAFNPTRWGRALSAVLYFNKGQSNTTISCSAAMQDSGGSVYYSQSASNSGAAGAQRLTVAAPIARGGGRFGSTWGEGTSLEQNEWKEAKSLAFHCSLPPQTTVWGYKVKTCQLTADCATDMGNDPEADATGFDFQNIVQANGIECQSEGPTSEVVNISRTEAGANNWAETPRRVFCPFQPPTDDTWEHDRAVAFTKVYYMNGSTDSNCYALGTCPRCELKWWSRNGTAGSQLLNTAVAGGVNDHYIRGPSSNVNIGKETQVGVSCLVPGGVAIKGITAYMSVSRVTDGM
jgi:hypothetical protein